MSKKAELFFKKRLNTLKPEQKDAYDKMLINDILSICFPTGVGKGHLMFTHLLYEILFTNKKTFLICTHRLGINTQHLEAIFSLYEILDGKIGYLFVGSSGGQINTNDNTDANIKRNYNLYKQKLATANLLHRCKNSKSIFDAYRNQQNLGRKTIIISTYHSMHLLENMHIDTMYCDEAHELASAFSDANKQKSFIENFKKIKADKKFFFTATPKDCSDDPDNTYLMNNEKVFGKRIGMTFAEAVENGYIVNVSVLLAKPSNYDSNFNNDFASITNKTTFILKAFEEHCKFVKNNAYNPDLINGKLLVKTNSVIKDMWPIYEKLKSSNDIKIFACASKDYKNRKLNSHVMYFNGETTVYNDRTMYLHAICQLKNEEKAIVLHYDTMSEGINIHNLTGLLFLTDKLPLKTKIMQNIGRIVRLLYIDSNNKELKVKGPGWIKPLAQVIIPYWSPVSETASNSLLTTIYDLVHDYNFENGIKVPLGDLFPTGNNPVQEPRFINKKEMKRALVEDIVYLTPFPIEDKLIKSIRISKINKTLHNLNIKEKNNYLDNYLNNL